MTPRDDVVIYRDPAAYCSHPCVARLANGELLIAFGESLPRRPWLHPPADPRFMTLVATSGDGGRTWAAPRVAPGYDVTGVECPSLTQLETGEVVLVQWRFAWYPLETARRLAARPDNAIAFRLPSRTVWQGVVPRTEADWAACPYPWARADAGLFVSISRDGGATWDETVRAPTAPFARGYSPRPPCQLPDGTVLLALGSHDEQGALYLLRSDDRCRTWSAPTVISTEPPLAEPTIACLPGGRLVVLSRHAGGYLHQHDSDDGGQTWTPPRPTSIWGYPAHLVPLRAGRLLAVYGHRRPPFGIRVCLSEDGGHSWLTEAEVTVRDDLPNANLGYPTAVELPDHRLFVAYYAEDAAGVTHVLGSILPLR